MVTPLPSAAAGASSARAAGKPSRRRLALGAALAAGAMVAAGMGAAVPAHAAAAFDPADPTTWPNVSVLDPSMSTDSINEALAAASGETEFSSNRHAVFFQPGTYGSDAGQNDPLHATGIVNGSVGFYETVSGLGASPDSVHINGALHVEPEQAPGTSDPWAHQAPGSLDTFWRSLSNLQINPIQQPTDAQNAANITTYGQADAHQLRWAVSQAAPLRRVDIQSDADASTGTTPPASLTLFGQYGEQASGGYLSDSKVSGQIISGSQQQWYAQDSEFGSWNGGVWNMVFSGDKGAPATAFPSGRSAAGAAQPSTNVGATPAGRDAPFLTADASGDYSVFVPAARTDARGVQWTATGAGAGTSLPLDSFFVARPSDSITTINAALASGKNLLLTPGIYEYDHAIRVSHANQVVLGLGMATLTPTAGNTAIAVDDVHGVQLSGITVDAGSLTSDTLVQVGPRGATDGSAADPTSLSDVFIRVGGARAGSANIGIEVNTPHTVMSDIWSWRADHGTGVGWNKNVGVTGLVVNGADVTADGLAVEHWQKNQVIWNGNGGTTIFYQSELPYDVPDQASWSHGKENGYASYKVADTVTSHEAWGLGVYSNFDNPGIVQENAIEAPRNAKVEFHDMVTRFLNQNGGITHIISGEGLTADNSGGDATATAYLTAFPGADTTAPTLTLTPSKAQPDTANGWYRGERLTASATDDFTPAATVQEQVDGEAWKAVTGPVDVPDGQHTLGFRAVDDAGNTSPAQTWSGKVDTVAPVTTSTVKADARTVTLAATDATSGVARTEYRVGTGAWQTYSGTVTMPAAETAIAYRSVDAAGNTERETSASVPTASTPGSVVLGTPRLSSNSQIFDAKAAGRATVTVSVTGASSGTVVFRNGSTTLASATIANGSAKATLPGSLKPGTYGKITAHVAATATHAAATSAPARTFTVVRPTLRTRVSIIGGIGFEAGTKPVLVVRLSTLTNGRLASGRLRFAVNGAPAGSMSVTQKQVRNGGGTVVMRLAKRYTKDIRVRVTFIGAPAEHIRSTKNSTSAPTSVRAF